mmetsp:Transcript_15400/g.27375  ORF Transcript_15400/g.27375 Transcript_15400/m.27375 type:complete len:356 (+) Transcript_15400:53-1120(+)
MEILVSALCGSVFGFALDRAKTNVPWVVASQMDFSNQTMLRMFLAGSASSTLAVLILHRLGVRDRKPKPGHALGLGLLGSYGANIVGGLLLGMGMTLTGSCPGTIWAQIGAGWLPRVAPVLAGGLFGVTMYGYADKAASENPNYRKETQACGLEHASIGYEITALAMAIGMIGVLFAVDSVFPWQNEVLAAVAPGTSIYDSWDPMLAGFALGGLQFITMTTLGSQLGQSSGWGFVAGNIMSFVEPNLQKHSPYLYSLKNSSSARNQSMMALGMIGGAALSTHLAGYPVLSIAADAGFAGPVRGFLGGAIMLIGARIGGGCTSGHGLSGMSTVSLASTLSVAFMFAGAIATKAVVG